MVKNMGNINICGKPKCCPNVTTDKAGKEVVLTENGATIKLTFEQVGKIYRDMCIQRNGHCSLGCCDKHE